ncbi:Calmodulin-binding protein 60 B [Hibiscus syriacus]|uniref:Calmodulin-binding protein 60 B n=1 Tax=Hibiscus syriacus TaxID=106335 RepID=A0A6A2Y9Q1_HIBSY|nr:Calmodulin-binding protein 60 B [Hibiscus syriacus]
MQTRGKRSLEVDENQPPERKRPALASVIVEALKVDSLQKLCSSLEPILRRVVSEEVERALAKLGPPRLSGRSSPKQIEGPDGRSLQLHFRSGHVVTTGPEASVKLDVVVLEGDFNNEDDEFWTQEEFDTHVVKEREGKRPLLTGDLQVTLKEGVGTLGDLTFTDNSSWIRSRKFRLGLKVASGCCEGIRAREAKTEAFTVKDHRGELYKKHYPPALNDEVWRLEKIGKDGSFHKKLNSNGIFTVEDFLRLAVKDQQRLRNILGTGMSNKMWEALLDHAKTCVLSGKFYVYYTDDTRDVGVVFNNIYELNGLISGEQYLPADSLSDSQKVYVDTLVKKAYDNWNQVIDYNGKSLVNIKQNRRSSARNELQMDALNYPNALYHQLQLPRLPVLVPTEHVHSGPHVGGFNDNQSTRYTGQPELVNSNSRSQFYSMQFLPYDQLGSSSQQPKSSRADNNAVGLSLGPPQSSALGFHHAGSSTQTSNANHFDDWTNSRDRGVEDFFSEEEIRTRSNEMLENEDMQHLLRLFSMGGHHASVTEDGGFEFPNMPSPMINFADEDRSRPGKAVVGWLKIKAAMRWGFFIRKKAAERQLPPPPPPPIPPIPKRKTRGTPI